MLHGYCKDSMIMVHRAIKIFTQNTFLVIPDLYSILFYSILFYSILFYSIQVSKANKVLGLLRRSFETLEKETLVWLFKALVRPHLEYCNTVTYHAVYENDAKLLEGVQRRATKMAPGMKNYDYANRLKKVALPSLSHRRKRGALIEVYINSRTDCIRYQFCL